MLNRRRAECIACGDDDIFIISAQYIGQLGDTGGLARAVDAGNENHRRAALGGMQLPVFLRPVAFQMFFEKRDDLFGGAYLLVAVRLPQIGNEFFGRLDAEIVADKFFFQFIKQFIINFSADSQYGRQRRTYFLPRLAEPVFYIVERF